MARLRICHDREPSRIFSISSVFIACRDRDIDDRVCVLNILGNESRSVTPTSHAYSGATSCLARRRAAAAASETKAGKFPSTTMCAKGLKRASLQCRRCLLPPCRARWRVRVDPRQQGVDKIIILTEKISVHDAREIRAFGQAHKIDIFGANSLGVADAWNHVRIGGALGGDNPEETLAQGSLRFFPIQAISPRRSRAI